MQIILMNQIYLPNTIFHLKFNSFNLKNNIKFKILMRKYKIVKTFNLNSQIGKKMILTYSKYHLWKNV